MKKRIRRAVNRIKPAVPPILAMSHALTMRKMRLGVELNRRKGVWVSCILAQTFQMKCESVLSMSTSPTSGGVGFYKTRSRLRRGSVLSAHCVESSSARMDQPNGHTMTPVTSMIPTTDVKAEQKHIGVGGRTYVVKLPLCHLLWVLC